MFLSRHFPNQKNRFSSVLSPISEKSSRDYNSTLEQSTKSISTEEVKINQSIEIKKPSTNKSPFVNEDRPITGKGAYDIDTYEYDHDMYSDDFESESDEETSSKNNATIKSSSSVVIAQK